MNVFIVSALVATLFFGGWTAPFNWPWAYNLDWFEPLIASASGRGSRSSSSLRSWDRPSSPSRSGCSADEPGHFWESIGLGFVFTIVAAVGLIGLAAFIAFDWVRGITWFMAKTYFFVIVFVWMRATLPRVRVDQLMGFAWKWLLPASLLNLFVTATAVVILNPVRAR